jgi:hypothetical protein
MASKSAVKLRWVLLACVVTLGIESLIVAATSPIQDESERRIWDTIYQSRPKPKTPSRKPTTKPVYRRKSPTLTANEVVGITIWRLRPATASDRGERLLEHPASETPAAGPSQVTAWIPERVEAGTPLSIGDRVRLSIETPRKGFLYVIDREQYADGTMSDPYLIFPTTRLRGGDHAVGAGRLIEIPAQEDSPNYFTLKPGRADQVAEVLTMLVTPKPLENLQIGREPLKLSKEQMTEWEKKWGAPVERFELVGGGGRAWTKAEKEAGATGTRLLTQEEAAPQTIYRVAAKPGETLMVTVELRYDSAKPAIQPPSR